MESNNSSSTPSFSYNNATASSSDSPPPCQRNDDKGKQTFSNESEANKNKNNNPDSSVLKPGNKGRSSSYRGVTRVEKKKSGCRWQAKICELYLGTFGTEKDAAEAYDIAAIRLKHLIPGVRELNFDLKNYNTEEILKCSKIPIGEGACKSVKELTVEQFLKKNNIEIVENDDEVGVVQFGAENQRVANCEGFVYMDDSDDVAFSPNDAVSLWNNEEYCYSDEPLMDQLLSRYGSLNDFKGLDSTEDIQKSFADKEELQQPSGGSNQAD